MKIQRNIANAMRAAKESSGKSLTEFADELEISRSTLQGYLSGTGNPSIVTVEHISQKLGIGVAPLVSGTFSVKQVDILIELLKILGILRNKSPEQCRCFAEHLQGMLLILESDNTNE